MSSASRKMLGIDQGTSGTRALVLDDSGAVRGNAYATHRQIRPADGWVEHDPREILHNLIEVARRAAAQAGGGIDAIGLANQGETVLAWDRGTGEPLHQALVWQDLRAQSWMEELARDAGVAERVAATTGLRLDAYFSAGKLRWLLDNVPTARALAAEGRLCLSTLDAWLLWKLTGRGPITDPSTAARTLLYDLRRLRWDPWLLELFGIPEGTLPEVVPSVGPFGQAGALGGAPLAASLVDQPAAMVGEGCLAAGQTKATFGTGCFVYANTGEEPRLVDGGGVLATVAWQRDGRVTYALDGGILAAGSMLAWLRDELRLAATDAELDALAEEGAGGGRGRVVCVPALVGLGAPWWRRGARAAWLGMGPATSRADLAAAVYEGLGCRVAQVLGAMGVGAIARLRVDGGLTASRTLMQAVADLTGVAVEISAEPEATGAGAAALAARGAGIWRDDGPILARVATASVVEPRIGAAERADRLARFDLAVELVSRFARGPGGD